MNRFQSNTNPRSIALDGLEKQVHQLVTEASRHRAGSPARQKHLTRIIRLITHKLYKEDTPYYQDALQQTWVYFCQNICEGNTGEQYDATQGSFVNWLNAYLKRRLQDFYIDRQKQETTILSLISRSESGDINLVDNLEANLDISPLLEDVRTWAKTDPEGELRRIYIEDRPDVNCQELLLRRLPPETTWKNLAVEFGLCVSTLSRFYQRQCMPRLRKFGELQGYL